MKKNLIRLLGVFLGVVMMASGISFPAYAYTSLVSGNSVSGNLVSDNFVSDNFASTENKTADEILMTEDVLGYSDEALDAVLMQAEYPAIGRWLMMLTDAQMESVIGRETCLKENIQVVVYEQEVARQEDEQQESAQLAAEGQQESIQPDESSFVVVSQRVVPCYEYALEKAMGGKMRAATWQNNGKCFIHIMDRGVKTPTTLSISGLKGKSTEEAQKFEAALTVNPYLTLGSGAMGAVEEKAEVFKYVRLNMKFDMPCYSQAYAEGTDSGWISWSPDTAADEKINFDDRNSYMQASSTGVMTRSLKLVAFAGDFGLSTQTQTTGSGSTFKIHIVYPSFSVSYAGNGATVGNTVTQRYEYGQNVTMLPSSTFSRAYAITFDGNGGQAGATGTTETWTFAGWGDGTQVTAPAGSVCAATTLNVAANQTKIYYAHWNQGTITLPAAMREGYVFDGWYRGTARVGTAGDKVSLGSDTVLKAGWRAKQYVIRYLSEGRQIATQTMTYDTETKLKTVAELGLVRQGYVFDGWISDKGRFADGQTVRNLAVEGNVAFNAIWKEATDTPYTVIHKFQIVPGKDEYLTDDTRTKKLKGTTGSVVTVVPDVIEGYVTPTPKQITIAADGSTVVEFLYTIAPTIQNLDTEATDASNGNVDSYEVISSENGIFRIETADVHYEIVRLADGSFAVKLVQTDQKNVTIPDIIRTDDGSYRVSEIQEKAFYKNKLIERVTISKGIAKISASAFEGCSALKSVTLQNGMVEIGNRAFKGCSQLKSIKLPDSVRLVASSAFENCTKLSKVSLNEGLLKIGNKAFKKCVSLKSVKIPNSVLAIGSSTFESCKKLKKVKFSQSDSQCYSVGSAAFRNCGVLTSAKLPPKVTAIRKYTFEGCKKLASVTIPSDVRKIDTKAFYKCSKLKKVTIKSKVMTGVGKNAFKKCKKGIQFKIPAKKLKAYKKLLKGKY